MQFLFWLLGYLYKSRIVPLMTNWSHFLQLTGLLYLELKSSLCIKFLEGIRSLMNVLELKFVKKVIRCHSTAFVNMKDYKKLESWLVTLLDVSWLVTLLDVSWLVTLLDVFWLVTLLDVFLIGHLVRCVLIGHLVRCVLIGHLVRCVLIGHLVRCATSL